MQMMVHFQNGTIAEAIILAAAINQIRVLIAGRSDTEEWRMFDGQFYDESGRLVEIDSMVAVDEIDSAQLFDDLYPRTATAGRVS
jgi:hypothetical protein